MALRTVFNPISSNIDFVGDGDVVGPSSATANAIARYDGTTGKLIKNSAGVISDGAVLTGLGIEFATSGGTPSTLTYYEAVTTTGTMEDSSGANNTGSLASVECRVSRVGNSVTGVFGRVTNLDSFGGVPPNNTAFIITEALVVPTRFLPTSISGNMQFLAFGTEGASPITVQVEVLTTGRIRITKIDGGNFALGNTITLNAIMLAWSI